jgi:hypothetical protein
MHTKNTNVTPSIFKMLKGYASHTRTSESSKNLESTEPRLEASLTLGSGSGQSIGNSNGVDSSIFLNQESDLEIPKQKPNPKFSGLEAMISPLKAIHNTPPPKR